MEVTSAGARVLAFSMAAMPSSASQQAWKGVALSIKLQIALRTTALSSTTRIHGFRGDGMAEETTSLSWFGQYEFLAFFVYCALRPAALLTGGHVDALCAILLTMPQQVINILDIYK